MRYVLHYVNLQKASLFATLQSAGKTSTNTDQIEKRAVQILSTDTIATIKR